MAGRKDILLNCYLTCRECNNTFVDPVSLSCNHSFCSSCLRNFWDWSGNQTCPVCERRSSKGFPGVNFTLKELADAFAGRPKEGSFVTETGETTVEVVCTKHQEEPTQFCENEGRAVCPACDDSLHQGHNLVPVEDAVVGLKEQLKVDLKSLKDVSDKYKRVEETYSEMSEHCREQLSTTEKQITAEFKKLHQFLKEEEEFRLAAVREEEEQKRKMISREIKMVQEQTSSLSDTISAVEKDLEKSNIPFLSSYIATQTKARAQYSDTDPHPVSGALIDVAKHLGNLSFRVWEKLKDRVHFSPVILDPNTANPWLFLSEDLTSARHGDSKEQLPNNPERCTEYPIVLGSKGFSSGKHSWEVEVGENQIWFLGLAKESFDRKGDLYPSPEYGIWCLKYHNGKYTNGEGRAVAVRKSLQRVSVTLNYDRGEVVFHNPEDNSHIYTHRETFSEKVFPYFGIGKSADAKIDVKISYSDFSLPSPPGI